ncbi:DUF4097 domain-containing protein [Streptomonospora sp. S1-112]|uniref:DUF4097 domain-containing protein n=1 Tax=Streptomonospora mangrovi TaxID=2883123 RepID=A0A9X3SEI2_9ACTN|nr:DUF4097 family beta strand repeat-containing protein [Streptomonospora mangrovi]MDA0563820.1 DUF4097 domain-containing protein [Streptomonospora mangrovi]
MPAPLPQRSARPRRAWVVPLVLAALTGCGSAAEPPGEQRGFALPDRSLTVSVADGDLDIRPADVAEVQVTRYVDAWSLTGADPRPTWKLSGQTLTLALDCGLVVFGRCDARYEVLVPRGVDVAVEGGSGEIAAEGFATALRVTSDNGAVRVADASGPLALETSSGRLTATGIAAGHTTAESENGEIDLSYAEVPDRVRATADNGAVSLTLPEAPYALTATTDSGTVDSDLSEDPGSPHTVTVTTDNGAIGLHTAR